MNPDFPKTAASITWTLSCNEKKILFKICGGVVYVSGYVEVVLKIEEARELWNTYIGKGFVCTHKYVDSGTQNPKTQPIPDHINEYLKEYMKNPLKDDCNNDFGYALKA